MTTLHRWLQGTKERMTAVRRSLNPRCVYFLGLSGLAFATLGALGMKLSTVRDPARYLNICSPWSLEDFRMIPTFARQAICTLYSGLQDLQSKQNRGAYTFVSQLLRVGPLLMTILSHESFRHKTFWRRRGASLYTLLAQALSGAVAVPLYFATLFYGDGSKSSKATNNNKQVSDLVNVPAVSGYQAWTILTSVTLGYLAPLAYGVYSHWSNRSITTFLAFPLFIMTINTILPSILKRSVKSPLQPQAPLLIIAGISTLLSLDGHLKLLFSGIPFKRIFWPTHTTTGMTQDLHMLLLHDYAFVLLELASFVFLYTYRSSTKREKVKAARLAAVVSLLAGPVAALSIIWTKGELQNISETTDVPRPDGSERSRLLEEDQDS